MKSLSGQTEREPSPSVETYWVVDVFGQNDKVKVRARPLDNLSYFLSVFFFLLLCRHTTHYGSAGVLMYYGGSAWGWRYRIERGWMAQVENCVIHPSSGFSCCWLLLTVTEKDYIRRDTVASQKYSSFFISIPDGLNITTLSADVVGHNKRICFFFWSETFRGCAMTRPVDRNHFFFLFYPSLFLLISQHFVLYHVFIWFRKRGDHKYR